MTEKQSQLPNEGIWLLPLLFSGLIITTNFDQVLETVYARHNMPSQVFEPDHPEMLNQYLNQVGDFPGFFKLHGSVCGDYIEYNRIIFTKKQYNNFYCEGSLLVESLKKCFSYKSVLFLGCSLSHDQTMHLLKQVIQPGQYHYTIINCEESEKDNKIKELENKHIRAIVYEGNRHEAVKVILNHLLEEKRSTVYNDDIIDNEIHACSQNHTKVISTIKLIQEGINNTQIGKIENDGVINLSFVNPKSQFYNKDNHDIGFKFVFNIDNAGFAAECSVETNNDIRNWFYDFAREDLSMISDEELVNSFDVEIYDERKNNIQKVIDELSTNISSDKILSVSDEAYYINSKIKLNEIIKEDRIKAEAIKLYMSDRCAQGLFNVFQYHQLNDIIFSILSFPYYTQYEFDNNADYIKLDIFLSTSTSEHRNESFVVHMKKSDVIDCFGGSDVCDIYGKDIYDMGHYKKIVAPYFYIYLAELKVKYEKLLSNNMRIMNLGNYQIGLH